MNLVALPAFADNYIWMLHDGSQALVVDPGEAAPVTAALSSLGLELRAILVTHHHPDHVGGVDALRPFLQGSVYGPARESIPQPFVPLRDGETLDVLGRRWRVIDVPGHTAGHIAFVEDNSEATSPILFCGDTLFSAGCGRLFEGTPAQMVDSLEALNALPPGTQVCCTHEYTLSNLRFASAVEPDNLHVRRHVAHCEALRAEGRPTLPSNLAIERRINPFLRCAEPAVIEAGMRQGATDRGRVAVFGALREWKNRFR